MPVRRLNKRRKTYKSKKHRTKRVKRTKKRKMSGGLPFPWRNKPAERDMATYTSKKTSEPTPQKTPKKVKVKRAPSSWMSTTKVPESEGAKQAAYRWSLQQR